MEKIIDFKKYHYDGFLILKNFLNTNIIKNILSSIEVLVDKHLTSNKHNNLNDKILELESIDHSLVYNIQKALGTSVFTHQLINELKIMEIHSYLYDVEKTKIHTHLFQTPVQFPSDERFDFSWHQESGSYLPYPKILTFWFPLFNKVNITNGTMALIPGSHKNGGRKFNYIKKESGLNDWVVDVSEEEISNQIIAELNPGDVVIFDSDLIHKSVANKSTQIRITGIARSTSLFDYKKIRSLAESTNYFSKEYQK